MPILAILSGAVLTALGPIFYALGDPGHRSFTAFIPTLFGVMILACGLAAQNSARTKAAMHAAVGIALLGAIGSFARILPKLGAILSGQLDKTQLGVIASTLMFLICTVFVALSIGRFIKMRSAG